MEPTLQEGDVLLLRRSSRSLPRVGQLVEVSDPRDGRRMIKRVIRVQAPNFWVQGDNASASRDSRHFGALRVEHYKGLARLRVGQDPWRLVLLS